MLNNRYLWAKSLVKQLESKWTEHKYNDFLTKATLPNFIESQAGLYHLLKTIPDMYLKVMPYVSEDAKFNLLQILYKEMGSGNKDKSQLNKFVKLLDAFDYKVNVEQHKNPFIMKYINDFLFIKTQSWSEMISYLAGAQYTLSFFKQKIAEYLYANKWLDSQEFYDLNEDFSTGSELLYVVANEDEIDKDVFINAQIELFYILEKLVVITNEDLKYIHSNRITNFITREDSNVELSVFHSKNSYHLNILSVCSGGEHIIKYLQQKDKSVCVDVYDINSEQLEVLQHKLKYIADKNNIKLKSYLQTKGKTEELIDWFNFYDINKYSVEAIKFACEKTCTLPIYQSVFSTDLSHINAHSFNQHFIQALKRGAFEHSVYINDIRFKNNSFEYMSPLNNQSTVHYFHQDMIKAEYPNQYDIIDISNISDSLTEDELSAFLIKLKNYLNDDGSLIIRSLISVIDIYPLLKRVGFNQLIEHIDETYLYTHVIEAKK